MNLTKLNEIKRIETIYAGVINFSTRKKKLTGSFEINIIMMYVDGAGTEMTFNYLRTILGKDYDAFMATLEGDLNPGSYYNEYNKKILVFERVVAAETFSEMLTAALKELLIEPSSYIDHIDIPNARIIYQNALIK